MSIPNKRVEELIGFLNEMGSSIIWQESGETGDILDALRELLSLRSVNGWVECSERLPQLYSSALIAHKGSGHMVVEEAQWRGDEWQLVRTDGWDDAITLSNQVRFWRPIPLPPPAAGDAMDNDGTVAARKD